jgi:branched-chain amino acid transport system ATP-binding protein
MTPMLSVRGLARRFGALTVTDAVDLDIEAGEIHAVIGPNGAGKTTLINQIAGELRSDAGRVMLAGADVSRWSVARRARAGLGRSFQMSSIIPTLGVLENMLLAVQARRGHSFRFWRPVVETPALVEAADHFLSLTGLVPLRRRQAGLLAYGQQRQLELAMTLAIEPKVLLLDEPMAGLGPAETQQMVGVLRRLGPSYAMLLVEHDMQAVFALATRVSVLVYGKIVFCGSPSAARQSPLVREAYLGDEEIAA